MIYEILLNIPPSHSHISGLEMTERLMNSDGFNGHNESSRKGKIEEYFKRQAIRFNSRKIDHSSIIDLSDLPKNKTDMSYTIGNRMYKVGLVCERSCEACKRLCGEDRRKIDLPVLKDRRNVFRRLIDILRMRVKT